MEGDICSTRILRRYANMTKETTARSAFANEVRGWRGTRFIYMLGSSVVPLERGECKEKGHRKDVMHKNRNS